MIGNQDDEIVQIGIHATMDYYQSLAIDEKFFFKPLFLRPV